MTPPEPDLVFVEAVAPHSLRLRFADGVEGVVDVSADLWGPIFEPLQDPEFFALVHLDEDGAPSWPNGADMAPDALYQNIQVLLGLTATA